MSFDLTPFSGIFPAGMTFFDADGDVDEGATLDHWTWLVEERQADGLVICGTSGEFIALTDEERDRLLKLGAEHFAGKIPLIAGSGHASTKVTIDVSKRAQTLGYDAMIVILPYYSRPPMHSILEHYRVLRKHIDRPIMLYNNPNNTASPAISPPDIARLVEEDVVHMVKSTMESVVPVHDLKKLVGDDMRIFYGSFLSAFEAFCAGAHGWVSGVLNVASPDAKAMAAAIGNSDINEGTRLWQKILPIVHLYTYQPLGAAMDIPIYRSILNRWGRHGGYSRPPFDALTDEQIQKLHAYMETNAISENG